MKTQNIKSEIKKAYGAIASNSQKGGCCATDAMCCSVDDYGNSVSQDYSKVEGYHKEADLALGCGLPTKTANIKAGDTVIDLGSGAGNDVFIARNLVGDKGKVIGIDMSFEMVLKARQMNQKLGYQNVEFILGDIESMLNIPDAIADVVISNCVMNLVPNKEKAFMEIQRVLKPGGHFNISDIVYVGSLPKGLLKSSELYTGCISGASEKGSYLGIIKSAGFKNIQIKNQRKIELSDHFMLKYMDAIELDKFKQSRSGIYSITVYADKLDEGACCNTTDTGCCGTEEKPSPDHQDKERIRALGCCE